VAERCIYGVDKNDLAVEMAKLSLWLVTLSRDKPFTFLNHALKTGDSLIGINSIEQIEKWDLETHDTTEDLFTSIIREKTNKAAELRETLETLTTDGILQTTEKENLNRRAEEELKDLKALANLLIAPEFLEGSDTDRKKLRGYFHSMAISEQQNPEELNNQTKDLLKNITPFNWPLEFPEVFTRENQGFDAMTGNPPFMGGQKITGNLGNQYREYLVNYHARGKRGSADLVAYFYLRAIQLLRKGGNFGLLAINTISEGDTRQTGLEQILKWKNTIYSTHPDEPWPHDAAVVTSRVHVHKGQWKGVLHRRSKEVPMISAFLSSREEWSPKKLKANANMSFQGSIVLGMGFVLEKEEALTLIEKDPRNKDVLYPYINGRDLNSHPEQKPSRWVINFWDWSEEKARTYPDVFRIVEEKVKPSTILNKYSNNARQYWWLYERSRPDLYCAIGRGKHLEKHTKGYANRYLEDVIVIAIGASKYCSFSLLENIPVFSHALGVIAFDSAKMLA
ncbi:ATP phosphoribosyltransferase regulatory subunit, partial [bacterium]|nr:ATP phosphoribosyltransferase regulatory subunit [bacterium]